MVGECISVIFSSTPSAERSIEYTSADDTVHVGPSGIDVVIRGYWLVWVRGPSMWLRYSLWWTAGYRWANVVTLVVR